MLQLNWASAALVEPLKRAQGGRRMYFHDAFSPPILGMLWVADYH